MWTASIKAVLLNLLHELSGEAAWGRGGGVTHVKLPQLGLASQEEPSSVEINRNYTKMKQNTYIFRLDTARV